MSRPRTAIAPNDIVLVHIENQPAFFARVERIDPDYKRGWWHVKFFVLALPMQVITWIIDDEQIRGGDFTMGGVPMRIEKVDPPTEAGDRSQTPAAEDQANEPLGPRKQARILAFGKKRPLENVDEPFPSAG